MDPQLAALAGLLHDVGKFWQRADGTWGKPPNYQQYTKDDFGKNGTHATWSAAFIEEAVPEDFRDVWTGVFYHHRPQEEMARIVALADHLSAGERETTPDNDNPMQLQSVFCQLHGANLEPHYWPLNELRLHTGNKKDLFPSTVTYNKKQATDIYRPLWDGFMAEAKTLRHETDLATYIESMQALMMRYTWSIPSAYYRSVPTISLYDHSRTTAALAASIAVSLDDDTVKRLLKHKDNTEVATLIEGDISGIQKFIYTVTAKNAAKSLRARSLYLQMLSQAIARMILRELGLPMTNILYVGGGHFYLIGSVDAIEKLPALQAKLDHFMLNHHDGDLYLALGTRAITAVEFNNPNRFSLAWREVGQVTKRVKRQRYANLPIDEQMSQVFKPRMIDGELGTRRTERDEQLDDDRDASALTQSLITLGCDMPRAEAVLMTEMDPIDTGAGDYNAALMALGYHVALVDDRYELLSDTVPLNPAKRTTLLGMERAPEQGMIEAVQQSLDCPLAAGVRFITNEVSMQDYHPTDFSDLQKASNGLKRLGVLRMDVDNLGQLFAKGFEREDGQSQATLSRVANLSFSLSLYFEGWVNQICKYLNEKQQRDLNGQSVSPLYVVYSGGDDLFIVGTWDVMPKLSHDIQRDLSEFASGNPYVHVSAGITLHTGKYPLYQAAADAEDALDKAKGIDGKNAIHFLGMTVKWDDWDNIGEMLQSMRKMTEASQKPVSRSLYQTILSLYEDYSATREAYRGHTNRADKPQFIWGPWLWRSAYRLNRLASRHPDHKAEILELQQRMVSPQFQAIEHVALAARWAEAYTRKPKSEKES